MVAEKYWILKNVCLEIWAPARARGRSTIFCQGLFVRKKKDTQTTDGRIVAVSFILGPPGLQTHVFSQPSSGNCNLFVLMLFPLGPAFIMSHSLTLNFSCLSSPMLIYDHHNHYFFLLGVSRLLVRVLGRSLFLIAGVCKGVRRMKKSSETRAQAVAAQQT